MAQFDVYKIIGGNRRAAPYVVAVNPRASTGCQRVS